MFCHSSIIKKEFYLTVCWTTGELALDLLQLVSLFELHNICFSYFAALMYNNIPSELWICILSDKRDICVNFALMEYCE